jgi:hypothetical protein
MKVAKKIQTVRYLFRKESFFFPYDDARSCLIPAGDGCRGLDVPVCVLHMAVR